MQLELKSVSLVYDPDVQNPKKAVDDISLTLRKGEFAGLIGHTGSGKSTLVQIMNGLLKPTEGTVLLDGQDVHEKGFPLRNLRRQVGLVFQYPEYQLFEETVLKDVCFGPKNLGLPKEEQEERAKKALSRVGLDARYYDASPFELSGGEKRRAAIAGVLAMEPDILILDEPTAGLDPQGRNDLLAEIRKLNEEEGTGIVLVSHSMEDVAAYASRLLVMNHARLVYDDTPRHVFEHYKELEAMGLSAPQVVYVMHALEARGLDVRTDVLTIEEAKREILRALGRK
ncbi:MAG: energy-coupling factor transporter ATPase [Lachnospiraceae bacterium]|nr:energy-coupling factor transporter ATPase [Lachnospiraceae bacterium]MBP5254941.1 energy-coupling factor transporter ATPase [Lachnospiraceae bacterium]